MQAPLKRRLHEKIGLSVMMVLLIPFQVDKRTSFAGLTADCFHMKFSKPPGGNDISHMNGLFRFETGFIIVGYVARCNLCRRFGPAQGKAGGANGVQPQAGNGVLNVLCRGRRCLDLGEGQGHPLELGPPGFYHVFLQKVLELLLQYHSAMGVCHQNIPQFFPGNAAAQKRTQKVPVGEWVFCCKLRLKGADGTVRVCWVGQGRFVVREKKEHVSLRARIPAKQVIRSVVVCQQTICKHLDPGAEKRGIC